MTNEKTVAERLREKDTHRSLECFLAKDVIGNADSPMCDCECPDCNDTVANRLADMIEAEQDELRAENERLRRDFYEPCARMGFTEHARGIETMCDAMSRVAQGHECRVDFRALDLLCDKLDCGDANHRATAEQIRRAISGAKPQLPEGIEWPRFEDGELVKLGDEFNYNNTASTVRAVRAVEITKNGYWLIDTNNMYEFYAAGEPVKRPEPEVLDADGVPIKVGDTVYRMLNGKAFAGARVVEAIEAGKVRFTNGCWMPSEGVTHCSAQDTQEDIDADAELLASDYCLKHAIDAKLDKMHVAKCRHILERQRKLMVGE